MAPKLRQRQNPYNRNCPIHHCGEPLRLNLLASLFEKKSCCMRVETDHHNLFIHPGFTSHLNHYALEVDDVDAIGDDDE